MLILTRRVGETLMIGDEVTVTVLGVKGNQVRIGVNAPKEVSVHRQVKMRNVNRLGKKLDKADDVVNSIWLQDYCSALSELIQDNCVVPKSEIKYNRYCPVRFKR